MIAGFAKADRTEAVFLRHGLKTKSLRQTSENNASTISRHFTPGITLRSIWFIT